MRKTGPLRRPVFFYSAWPIGYHNAEAERRAHVLAEAGYEVTYVTGIGIRNPGLSNLPKLADRVGRKLGVRRSLPTVPSAPAAFERSAFLHEGAIIAAPPRQYRVMRRLNASWIERQLRRQIAPWSDALAWIRWPTPELVDALPGLAPQRTVYEASDLFEATPGIIGRWKPIFDRAERALVARADVVVVPGELLAARYRGWGAEVRVVPHGVDLVAWPGPRPRGDGPPIVVGFVGTLDDRMDVPALRLIAQTHPEWQVRLIGPVHRGFDPRRFSDLPNVSIEPPVPVSRVPSVLATFDLGVMPYVDTPVTAHMTPVKTLELLAAGVPAVARRLPSLKAYDEHLYFADLPHEYVAQLERALAEDSPERAAARRRVAELHGWPRRLAEIVAIVGDLTGGPDLGR